MEEIVNVEAVSRSFPLDNRPARHPAHSFVSALTHASLRVTAGEFLAIAGPSGSGKTTLLNLIGCIDQPTTGRILVDGVDTSKLKPGGHEHAAPREDRLCLSDLQSDPRLYRRRECRVSAADSGRRAAANDGSACADALESVGLSARANQRPDLLSGGERQRVAVARAIVHRPALVLADEPTANLDTHNATQLIDLMHGLNRRLGLTFIFSTHDARLLEHTERIVRL